MIYSRIEISLFRFFIILITFNINEMENNVFRLQTIIPLVIFI